MSAGESTVRIGPAGWAYDDWKGIVYPPQMPRGQHPLTLLCTLFDCVEINVTFYRPPNAAHCVSWLRKIEPNPAFRFTAKLWERFTHQRDSWPAPHEVRAAVAGLEPLRDAGRLGAVLAQFPWSFRRTPEHRDWLLRVTDAFSDWPLAVEMRHASWDCPAFFEGLRNRNVAFCNIDQPLLHDCLAPSEHVTAPFGYVRLHGRNREHWFQEGAGRNARYDYLYRPDELAPWLEKVRAMLKRVRDLYIVTNNHFHGQAVANAVELQAALGVLKAPLPATLAARYPRLQALPRNVLE